MLSQRTRDWHWKNNIISGIPDWPRKEAVAKFRMATGHDCLAGHLHRLGMLNSPCYLCNSAANMDSHHLQLCTALTSTSISDRYWEARERWCPSKHWLNLTVRIFVHYIQYFVQLFLPSFVFSHVIVPGQWIISSASALNKKKTL